MHRLSPRLLKPALVSLILLCAACSGTTEETDPVDSSTDGATDLGSFDTADDSGSRWDGGDDADADSDAPADTPVETGEDAEPDGVSDIREDPVADAGPGTDAGPDGDAGADADAGPDADAETHADARPDAELDVGECSVGADCEDDDPCTTYSCVDRVCVSSISDSDGDGSPDGACGGTDCDDEDEEISAGSERLCTNDCGVEGIERCASAEWTACSAPPDCDCTPGEDREEDCAMCGTGTRVCEGDGTWGELGACTGGGECEPDDISLLDCDGLVCGETTLYGVRALTCSAACSWSPGACLDAPPCCPGDTSDQVCGACGAATRTCDEDGRWGEYGACDEPECCAGDTDVSSCGDCGLQTRDCAGASWGPWDGCTEPECCAGDLDSAPCGDCGAQSLGCVEGAWSPIELCDEPECCPSETDIGECGDCGTQTRSCVGEIWGSWGVCMEPVCCEEDTESLVCNECGGQTRTCGEGSWGEYGTCVGLEGPTRGCDPGFLCNVEGFCYCGDPPCELP